MRLNRRPEKSNSHRDLVRVSRQPFRQMTQPPSLTEAEALAEVQVQFDQVRRGLISDMTGNESACRRC